MSPERFEHLLSLVAPHIVKKECRSREPISPSERLVITLRYLATGDSQQSQSFNFRVGRTTVCNIIFETCLGIWNALHGCYVKVPKTAEEWECLAKEFETEWNFPNCVGAIDGKHIAIERPHNAGSAFYNYKNFHSTVLLAICDAKYCFTMLDIGAFGRDNDAGVLTESQFENYFENNVCHFPEPKKVGDFVIPYLIVGDDIFPLKTWLMKPMAGKNLSEEWKVYNYRLSRCRRTIENAFGILSARWRIFRRPIRASPVTVDRIVQATVCLYNYLRLTENSMYIPSGFVDSEDNTGNIRPGDWRAMVVGDNGGLLNLGQIGGNRYRFQAGKIRTDLKDYFNSQEGSVPWQLKHVHESSRK